MNARRIICGNTSYFNFLLGSNTAFLVLLGFFGGACGVGRVLGFFGCFVVVCLFFFLNHLFWQQTEYWFLLSGIGLPLISSARSSCLPMLSTASMLLAVSHKKQCNDPQPIHSERGRLHLVLPCTSPLRLQSTLQLRVSPPHCAQWQQRWNWSSFFAANGPPWGVCPKKICLCVCAQVWNTAWTSWCLRGCWRVWRNHLLLFSSPRANFTIFEMNWMGWCFFAKKWVRSEKWAILFSLHKKMCDDQSKTNKPSELLLASS